MWFVRAWGDHIGRCRVWWRVETVQLYGDEPLEHKDPQALVEHAWAFAKRDDMTLRTDLVHYSLLYFTQGADDEVQLRPEDVRLDCPNCHCERDSRIGKDRQSRKGQT